MSHAPEEVQKIRYSINFPDSLIKSKKDLFITIYKDIYNKIEADIKNNNAGNIFGNKNKNNPNPNPNFNNIFFEVDKEYKYYFLSQLNLLKMKYIEYGIYFYEIQKQQKK